LQSTKLQGRSPLAGIKKLTASVAKSKNELFATCSILLLGLAGIQVYNDVGSTPSQLVAMPRSNHESLWLSPTSAADDNPTQLVSLPLQTNSLKKNPPVHSPTGNLHGVNSIAISPDGRTLVSGSRDGTIQLWQLDTRKVKSTLKGHIQGVNSLAFSPDGQTLASGGEDNTIKIWKLGTESEPRTLKEHSAWVSSVAFSPDGKTLVSGSFDNTIKIWNLKTGALLRTINSQEQRVFALAISPDGETLASGSGDGTIQIWDLGTGERLRTIKGHRD
jgi:WD40 repeat protein